MKFEEKIVKYFNLIYKKNLTTSSGGNISLRVGNKIFISPTGINKSLLTPSDIAIYDIETKEIINNKNPSCELQMHLAIYNKRKNINAIIHAHSEFVTIFSVIEEELKIHLLSEAFIILKNLKYVDYFRPSSAELAQEVAKLSSETDFLILRNHGAIYLGSNLEDCFHKLEVSENLAKIQYRIINRNDVKYLSKSEINDLKEFFH